MWTMKRNSIEDIELGMDLTLAMGLLNQYAGTIISLLYGVGPDCGRPWPREIVAGLFGITFPRLQKLETMALIAMNCNLRWSWIRKCYTEIYDNPDITRGLPYQPFNSLLELVSYAEVKGTLTRMRHKAYQETCRYAPKYEGYVPPWPFKDPTYKPKTIQEALQLVVKHERMLVLKRVSNKTLILVQE